MVMCQEAGAYTLVSGNFKILTLKTNMATNTEIPHKQMAAIARLSSS